MNLGLGNTMTLAANKAVVRSFIAALGPMIRAAAA
jgi:hypothetical protein